jgi:hypothetical protein
MPSWRPFGKAVAAIARAVRVVTRGALPVLLLVGLARSAAGEAVTVTGVASPQTAAERDNLEALRARAIQNALELAVMRVAGALVTADKEDSLNSREQITGAGTESESRLKQDSLFRTSVVTHVSGYSRLLGIEREWQADGSHHVEARVDVDTDSLGRSMKELGLLWERAGMPAIYLSVGTPVSEPSDAGVATSVLGYLRDNLASNGVQVLVEDSPAVSFHVPVNVTWSTQYWPEFETHRAVCDLAYEILHRGAKTAVAAGRSRGGPVAAFTPGESVDRCLKTAAPDLARALMAKIAGLLGELWNNGRTYRVTLSNVPAGDASSTVDEIQRMFRVNGVRGVEYADRTLTVDVVYKGRPDDFVSQVTRVFEVKDRPLRLERLGGDALRLRFAD